jgi:hypothetical protein
MFLLLASMFLATFSGIDLGAVTVASHLTPQSAVKHHHSKMNQNQQTRLEDILTDQNLWGEDFPSVLKTLEAFTRAGEQQVSVFPDKILGRTKYTRRAQAEANLYRLAQGLKVTPKVRSSKLESFMAQARTALAAQVIQFPDDRTFRISTAGVSAQFLKDGLTISDVEGRLGKAEKVTTEVLDDGTERRPVILTLHHYAGGAIIFVESDVNPNIHSVDRVFLDVSRISATLF